MFEHLRNYRVVIVTGPQRSGTTICAKMIAADTGLQLVLEEQFGVHDRERWETLVREADGVVVQCPAMCHYADAFGNDDGVMVVLMHRPLDEIHASEKRIRWRERGEHLRELAKYGLAEGDPAIVKYAHWQRQRQRIRHTYEVDYHALRGHYLWVPRQERATFAPRQVCVSC